MSEWQKKAALTSGDVVYFEYVTSRTARESPTVYVWDLDKTYLDTHFDSLRGVIRIALEKAFQKKNVPGTGSLVRALTSSRVSQGGDRPFPIFFVTASPPQMEKKIRLKLELDGINPYGAFFKDNLKNLRPKYFRRLSQQIGFKLQALMELRTRLKEDVQQILWGDDSESDAVIYSLYSDFCGQRIPPGEMRELLLRLHVTQTQVERIFEIARAVPKHDPVQKIYINLATDTDPDYYAKFGRRLIATSNTFQAALDLYQDGRLDEVQVLRVTQDMTMNFGFTPDEMAHSLRDMMLRGVVTTECAERILPQLLRQSVIPANFKLPSVDIIRRSSRHVEERPWLPQEIDYLTDMR